MKYKLFAVVLLAVALSGQGAPAQTASGIPAPQLTCGPGATSGAVLVYMALGFGVPSLCAQLDPAGFVLDKTTVPWTIRAVSPRPLQQTVTSVTSSTPNSFALPTGATACIVSRNIPQSPGTDYNITAGAVVFVSPPNVGDVVQLNCW